MKKEFYFFLSKLKNGLRLILIVSCIGFGTNSAFAQTQTVQGSITDESGEPLPGANIIEKGTSNGSVSDFDGNYSINVSAGATIAISYVGYDTKEIVVGSQTSINASLQPNNTLDEVVVVGYGTKRKSDLTGATSSVGTKDFDKQPISRVEDALQGRAAGVQVIKNSGAPGADVKVRIRGANSITGNNQPLVVIDNVIGAELRSINSNDIASMEILKDASATAIYGSRGANGVILITTKRGKGKPSINIDLFSSVSNIVNTIDVLSPEEFASINNLTVSNGGTNYQKEYFNPAFTNNLQVSLSGKKEGIGYFVSGNIVDQEGVSLNTNYKRYSLRSNLDVKLTDKLKATLNIYGGTEQTLNLISGGSASSSDTRAGILAVLGWDPTLPIRDQDGNYNLTSSNGSGLINPIAQRLEASANGTINTLNANLNLTYDITNNLKFTVVGGLLSKSNLGESYFGVPAGTVLSNPSGGGGYSERKVLQNSNFLTWNKDFDKHNLKITGLFEIQKFTSKGLNANGGTYSIPANYYALDLGTTPSVRSNLSKSEIQSYMGRVEYNFNRDFFFTGTLRADTSSKFRPENQTGYFPSASVAYQFKELFNNAVQTLKIRAGYGEVGNQDISPYSTYNSLSTGQNYPLNGTSETTGITLGTIANPDLTWETTKQTNIGFDAKFLNGRLILTANKYWKNTTDLLLAEQLPSYLGGGSILKNVGEVFNGGWEFDIDAAIIDKENFRWDSKFNFSFNKSEVVALAEGQEELLLSPLGGISNTTGSYVQLSVGEPLGQFYGATYLGTHKTGSTDGTPGEANYLKNNEGELEIGIIGNGTPTTTWALNNTLTMGDFDVNFLLRGVHGFDVFNFTRGVITQAGGVQSLPTHGDFRNRWTTNNPSEIATGGDHYINSTRFLEKGDFIKLSNLALGYNISNDTFKSLRIYTSVQNLLTLTDYSGYDPEASSVGASNGAAASIDYGANPNTRTFTLGIKLGF